MNKIKLAVITVALLFGIHIPFIFEASAQSMVPKVRHSLTPLDLSRPPATEELMAAGQLGGQLYPTDDGDINKKDMFNLSFGNAIQEWNRHNYKEAVGLFSKHIQDFPDSPWVS